MKLRITATPTTYGQLKPGDLYDCATPQRKIDHWLSGDSDRRGIEALIWLGKPIEPWLKSRPCYLLTIEQVQEDGQVERLPEVSCK